MTTVEDSAYIAALHKKLADAERSLNEFRTIFNHFIECRPERAGDLHRARRQGLYAGQISNAVDPSDFDGNCDT